MSIEIVNGRVFVEGKETIDPALIGYAVLDMVEEKQNIVFHSFRIIVQEDKPHESVVKAGEKLKERLEPVKDKRLLWLGIINTWLIQLLFIRIFSNRKDGAHTHYGILYWVCPFTGWTSNYKIIGKEIKYKHFK